MSDEVALLLTILYDDDILRVAIKIKRDRLPDEYYAEHKELIRSWLPEHIKSCGPIIHVEDIFDLVP